MFGFIIINNAPKKHIASRAIFLTTKKCYHTKLTDASQQKQRPILLILTPVIVISKRCEKWMPRGILTRYRRRYNLDMILPTSIHLFIYSSRHAVPSRHINRLLLAFTNRGSSFRISSESLLSMEYRAQGIIKPNIDRNI